MILDFRISDLFLRQAFIMEQSFVCCRGRGATTAHSSTGTIQLNMFKFIVNENK